MRPLAAVTGGTGFLGYHLIKRLCSAGWQIRMLTRKAPSANATHAHIETILGSLEDFEALNRLVEGAAVVVHVAGAIKARNRQEFLSVNAIGTQALVAACEAKAPETRLITISSLAAREPDLSPYTESKAKGDFAVKASRLNWCILRPAAIYGPGDRETLVLFKLANSPMQPQLNLPKARICLVHVEDVVNAVLSILQSNESQGIFEVTDERKDGYSWQEILCYACAVLGRTYRPILINPRIMQYIARLKDFKARFTGHIDMLSSHKLPELFHLDWSSAQENQLSEKIWVPNISIETGFHDATSWYRSSNWLR